MEIGLDFDDVIALSHPLKRKTAKEMFGVDIPLAEFRRENILAKGLLTLEQYKAVGFKVFNEDHQIDPVRDSLMYIRILLEAGHKIRVVTSRSNQTLRVTERWMNQHALSHIPIVGVGYGVPKVEACRGLDVYVDDDATKLAPLVGTVKHLLMFSWPQNNRELTPKGVHRVDSWGEIYDYIYYET